MAAGDDGGVVPVAFCCEQSGGRGRAKGECAVDGAGGARGFQDPVQGSGEDREPGGVGGGENRDAGPDRSGEDPLVFGIRAEGRSQHGAADHARGRMPGGGPRIRLVLSAGCVAGSGSLPGGRATVPEQDVEGRRVIVARADVDLAFRNRRRQDHERIVGLAVPDVLPVALPGRSFSVAGHQRVPPSWRRLKRCW